MKFRKRIYFLDFSLTFAIPYVLRITSSLNPIETPSYVLEVTPAMLMMNPMHASSPPPTARYVAW